MCMGMKVLSDAGHEVKVFINELNSLRRCNEALVRRAAMVTQRGDAQDTDTCIVPMGSSLIVAISSSLVSPYRYHQLPVCLIAFVVSRYCSLGAGTATFAQPCQPAGTKTPPLPTPPLPSPPLPSPPLPCPNSG